MGLLVGLPVASWGNEIPCGPVESDAIQIDGLLGDWQGADGVGVDRESQIIRGQEQWSGPKDLSFDLFCNHDAQALYLAIYVKDEYFIRTWARKGDDHLTVYLGGRQLIVYPGNLHGIPGRVTWGKSVKARGIKMAEALQTDGYSVEVRIPFKAIFAYKTGIASFPGAVWVADADSRAKQQTQTIMGTAPSPRRGRFTFAQAKLDLAGFLNSKGYSARDVRIKSNVDVVGDQRMEQVVLAGRTIGIIGEDLPGGNFLFLDLPVRQSRDIYWLKIMDLNGDRKMELITRYIERSPNGRREIVAVFRFNSSDGFIRSFAHEVLKGQGRQVISNRVSFKRRPRRGKRPGGVDLIFDHPVAKGFTPDNFHEDPSRDCLSIILPWDESKRHHFRFEGDEYFQE